MQQGADARQGIWPHRVATTAFRLAAKRGYDELVTIIRTAATLAARPEATMRLA